MRRDRCAKRVSRRAQQTPGTLPPDRTAAGIPHAILPGVSMRRLVLSVAVSALLPFAAAHAAGEFIPINTPSVQLTGVSPNGEYAVGAISYTAGFRWTASSGAEDLLTDLNSAQGINNAGTIAGSVAENGGANEPGGRDLGAYAPLGAAPVLLTDTLQTNATGYGVSDDGTVVGLSFNDGFVGEAVAYSWNATDGMSALAVNRPANYSRANAISADGHVIVGWNDQDDGGRTAVIWIDGVPMDVQDDQGNLVGEASAVTADGGFVVGSSYFISLEENGAWRWSAEEGVQLVPGMPFAFGVSADGNTVVGSTGFFDNPPRSPMVWRKGVGTVTLADFLAEHEITIPEGWDMSGGLTGISADGNTLVGWAFGPLGMQSYVIRLQPEVDDMIFADGFDAAE